nr:uncharacterized protein LOC107440054 [Parasteatoda tepidariorum]
MSDIFTNIRRFSNSSDHFIAIEMNIEESDIDDLPLFSDDFYLTDAEKCFLRLDVEESRPYLKLELSDQELFEFIRGFSVFIIDDEEHTIHSGKLLKNKISPTFDFLQDFVEHYTDIKYPILLFIYIETQNVDFKNVKNAQCTEVVKSETSTYDNEQIDCLLELSSNFKKIQEQNIGTDVILKVGGEKIEIHKTILQARSPRLYKMFEESSNKCVEIKDVRISIVKEFIAFLYTGTKKSYDFKCARELYCAAVKYEVPSLQNVCKRDMLSHHIQKDNACQMLVLADQHRDVPFKEEVMAFIKANLESIIESKSFEDLNDNYPKLGLSLMRCHFKS